MGKDKPRKVSNAPEPIAPLRGGGSFSIRPQQCEGAAADWETWGDMNQEEVWKAVALSLNLEPEKLPGMDWRAVDGDIFGNCPEEFRRRLKIACNAVESLLLPTDWGAYHARSRVVNLAKFAQWTATLNRSWNLPVEFPRGAAPAPTVTEPTPDADDAGRIEPLARWAAQEQTILKTLRELKYSPRALPKTEAWTKGVKSEVRAAIGSEGMWHSPKVFDKAWERLRERGDIADKP